MDPSTSEVDVNSQTERCELCIVGAGIGGLNALFAATRHLSPRDRVIVVDRRPVVGGMWNSTYQYVRLHQPHPMFTAGNIAWQGSRPREHLARREEVVSHLRHCFDVLGERVDLELRGGYTCEEHEEDVSRGVVLARCTPVDGKGPALHIEAKRLVHAASFGVTPLEPLAMSSTHVRSVAPDTTDLFGGDLAESSDPIYVVGGGKTGMDTAHTLIERYPGRAVRLLIGAGTLFMERDQAFPTGLRRHFGGTVGVDMFRDLASLFDGDNEREVIDRFRQRYAIGLDPRCSHHMFGLLSRHENETIRRGADAIILDHLEDVVDGDSGPVLKLRSGATQPVEPGSWFINATGYFKDSPYPYQPFASKSGQVAAINPRSVLVFLPAYAGYLMVHAAYGGQLTRLPLYELDGVALRHATAEAFMPAVATHMLYNLGLLLGGLDGQFQREFGVNTGTWFPWYRQLGSGLRLMRFQKQHPDHLRASLDRVRERFGVRLGPLER